VRFLFEEVPPADVDGEICRAAHDRLAALSDWTAASIEEALRALVEELGQKPRQAFAPIRLAITGSKVSPGLFESIELLGRERSLQRLDASSS
jgi:glutamyl-tRNA synthetase